MSEIAQNKEELTKLKITHVLNAAHGEKSGQINTNKEYYQEINISFYGINLMDVDNCKIEKYFHMAADYIKKILQIENSKLLIHCYMGNFIIN